jgi:uroporphyrinogen decarboxylase
MFDRSYETMTSKERVRRTFNFEKSDRVPINYFTNPTIHMKFAKALGVDDGNYEKVLDIIGVDFRGVGAPYKGPMLFRQIDGLGVDPVYGFYTKLIYNESGYYHDFCNFPLQDADDEIIANFPVPNPDDFDYSNIENALEYNKNKAIHIGGAGHADIINSTGRVMGMEETLVRLYNQDEATLTYLDRRLDMEIGTLERIMQKAKGKVDFLWLGEDLGTQIAPMISLDLYRKVFRPRHQKFVDLAKSYNLPVMIHTCGSSSWVYNDFIEMGINAVDTLQPEAVNMNPKYLKDNFGGKLCFHGCISTVSTLTDGSVKDVENNVKETIETFRDLNCYMLSPTHQIQDNTPVENVIAMYKAAHEYGRYET